MRALVWAPTATHLVIMVPTATEADYNSQTLKTLRGDDDPPSWQPTTANKLKKQPLSVHVTAMAGGGSEIRFDFGYVENADWTKGDIFDLFQPRLEKVLGESLRIKSVRDVRDNNQMEEDFRWLRS